MARLYKGSTYRPATHTLTLRPPTTSGGLGAPVLRDAEVIAFCRGVLEILRPAG